MKGIDFETRKTFVIRPSGRSSDYIAPSFGYGCLLNCTYCYMKRHKPEGLSIAKNVNDILTTINNHALFDTTEKPNQTDPEYITYDISCNEDFALHRKHYDWERIFEFFRTHPKAKATLATKIIPTDFLSYNPEKKVRIRFSLMPQSFSSILEPNAASIKDRILTVNDFIEAGYEVHLNFSPVIICDGWLDKYKKLFKLVEKLIDVRYKDQVKAEVIFLTHNRKKHNWNIEYGLPGEDLLWTPYNQETKVSEYGGENIRYISDYKLNRIEEFKLLHHRIIPWNTIRYIF